MAASLGPLVPSLSCRPFDREIMPNRPTSRVAVENKKGTNVHKLRRERTRDE